MCSSISLYKLSFYITNYHQIWWLKNFIISVWEWQFCSVLSFTQPMAGGPTSSPVGSQGLPDWLLDRVGASQSEHPQREQGKPQCLCGPQHGNFIFIDFILFVGSWCGLDCLWVMVGLGWGGIRHHVLKVEVSINLWAYLKPSHALCFHL